MFDDCIAASLVYVLVGWGMSKRGACKDDMVMVKLKMTIADCTPVVVHLTPAFGNSCGSDCSIITRCRASTVSQRVVDNVSRLVSAWPANEGMKSL